MRCMCLVLSLKYNLASFNQTTLHRELRYALIKY